MNFINRRNIIILTFIAIIFIIVAMIQKSKNVMHHQLNAIQPTTLTDTNMLCGITDIDKAKNSSKNFITPIRCINENTGEIVDNSVCINLSASGYIPAKPIQLSYTCPIVNFNWNVVDYSQTLVLYPFNLDFLPSFTANNITTLFTPTSKGYIGNDGFGPVYEQTNDFTTYLSAIQNNTSYSTLNISSIENLGRLILYFECGKGGDSDPRGFAIRTSIDNYANDISNVTLPSGVKKIPSTYFVNVNSENFNNITIRFYSWSPASALGTSVDFRNLYILKH